MGPTCPFDPARPTVLAHISDPHMACLEHLRPRELLNKRILGYVRWQLHRRTRHRFTLLSAAAMDLLNQRPDQVVVTGDLTHLGLPEEFTAARGWLETLGPRSRVAVVPGNHDTYVASDWRETFARWTDHMTGDTGFRRTRSTAGFDDLFPWVRVRGGMALIGVNTALPSPPHLAVGRVGDPQLRRLGAVLQQTGSTGLFRVVCLHHPPVPGTAARRKRLTDAQALCRVLAANGAELVVHGHLHRWAFHTLNTPGGSIPVVGAPSASCSGTAMNRRAGYHLFRLARAGGHWDLHMTRRIYAFGKGTFATGRQTRLRIPVPVRPSDPSG